MASQVALSNAEEVRADIQMVMKPYANWEAFLTPAPLSIALMGELVFISAAQDDFSIGKNPPTGGFQYMKHPDSFRASLMQVCNTGWHAFNEAHNNMDQIRLHTSTVPDYMKAAVKFIFSDSDKVVEKLLPLQLNNIGSIADSCVTLAQSTENRFMEVIKLIGELLEASVSTNKVYGDELKKVQMTLEESKLREKEVEKIKERSQQMMNKTEEGMEKAQKDVKEAMDSLPSGLQLATMDAAEGFISFFTGRMFKSGYKTASQIERENVNLRIEQSRERLNYARKEYEKNLEEMKQSEKELTEILVKMRKCNLEKVDFETTIKMLREGLGAMTQVKTQWEKMVQFFQMISNIIKVKLSKKLKNFVETTKLANELSYEDKLFVKDELHQQAFQASSIASLVNMLSGTYTEVSNNYLMDSVNNLGQLMVMDKDDKEFQDKREKMHKSCEKAQQGILELVEKNKKEYDENIETRMLKMDGELNAILPGQPQETDRIREITE